MSTTEVRTDDTDMLVERAAQGDRDAQNEFFARYTPRLLLMARCRLDPRLRGLVEPSDIVQQTYLVAVRRLGEYVRTRPAPVFLWLRRLTHERVLHEHRYHLQTKKRDRRREIRMDGSDRAPPSSCGVSQCLVARGSSPGSKVGRDDLRTFVERVLNELDELDREVLVLRHFERLTSAEAAVELGVTEAAVKKRHVRALQRFREKLEHLPGGLSALA